MQAGTKYIFLVITATILVMAGTLCAQHISFGTWAGAGLTLTKGTPQDLNFNDKTPLIITGISQSVTISLTDMEAAVLTIEGTEYLDVTVYVDAPTTLELDGSNHIPVSIRFAYSNLNPADVATAKTQAVEVPAGFNSATFPILRRTSGPPGPPPTPPHEGYTPPKKTAYLFIYGTLGPVGNVDAGLYDGTINVRVEYSIY
jgi:hypothetical protein